MLGAWKPRRGEGAREAFSQVWRVAGVGTCIIRSGFPLPTLPSLLLILPSARSSWLQPILQMQAEWPVHVTDLPRPCSLPRNPPTAPSSFRDRFQTRECVLQSLLQPPPCFVLPHCFHAGVWTAHSLCCMFARGPSRIPSTCPKAPASFLDNSPCRVLQTSRP